MNEVLEKYALHHRIGLILGAAVFLVMLALPAPAQMSNSAWKTTALTALMAIWWMSEAVPVFVTALLPIVLLPVLDIANIKDATAPYANPIIFLFMGGFFIALAIEAHGLHRRLALWLLSKISPQPPYIVGGFMLVAALISMWVSNSATTLMMLPIGQSLIELLMQEEDDESLRKNFSASLMLSIAYSSSIGGLGTLVGTPPNALFAGFMNETYKVEISFMRWAMLGVPVVVLSLPLAWLVMTRFAFALPRAPLRASRQAIALQLQALGPMTRGEKLVGTVFIITALLWIFEPLLSSAFPKAKLSDAGIAIFGAVLLFLLPVDFKAGQFAMELKQAKKLPYEVLILFGGGISLAQAIQKSGLATFVSQSLSHLSDFSLLLMMFLVALAAIFATELIGNTALAATMLPIVAPVALAMGENPIFLLLPAALGVSCAFMLPVGTPPNAIVYASGYINMPQMVRAGLWLNALFTVLLTFLVFFLAPLVFEAQFGTLPEWAKIQK